MRSAALLVAGCLLLAACGDDDGGSEGAAAPAATTATEQANAGCEPARPITKRTELEEPRRSLDSSKTHVVVLETTCGTIEVTLDTKRAPLTSASVANLARRGFYDGLGFHRIGRDPAGEDFVIQGGDPTGTGSGGPGYTVVEAPPPGLRYTRGTVAMAKTQLEDPGTSGSQFYIVTADDAGLPPEYALAGRVTKGDDVVTRIAAVEADPQTEIPTKPVVIKRARHVTR
jgi:peptidyl-prolyl cis-trans isomerase B (cyclophilin B)